VSFLNPVPPRIGGLGGNRLRVQIRKLHALTPNPSPNFGRGEKKIQKILRIFKKNPAGVDFCADIWGIFGEYFF